MIALCRWEGWLPRLNHNYVNTAPLVLFLFFASLGPMVIWFLLQLCHRASLLFLPSNCEAFIFTQFKLVVPLVTSVLKRLGCKSSISLVPCRPSLSTPSVPVHHYRCHAKVNSLSAVLSVKYQKSKGSNATPHR